MAFVGIVILAATVYLAFMWTGERWLLWMLVGVAAVIAQLNSYVWDYGARFRLGHRMPTQKAFEELVQGAESDLWRNLGRTPVVIIGIALVAWLGRVKPTFGVWLQVGFAALMWFGVILGWITAMRFRRALRRAGR